MRRRSWCKCCSLGADTFTVLFSHVVENWKSTKYTQPLIGTLEPLPETGILANHSSDFSLVRQPAVHTDLFMEVAPRPKNLESNKLYGCLSVFPSKTEKVVILKALKNSFCSHYINFFRSYNSSLSFSLWSFVSAKKNAKPVWFGWQGWDTDDQIKKVC